MMPSTYACARVCCCSRRRVSPSPSRGALCPAAGGSNVSSVCSQPYSRRRVPLTRSIPGAACRVAPPSQVGPLPLSLSLSASCDPRASAVSGIWCDYHFSWQHQPANVVLKNTWKISFKAFYLASGKNNCLRELLLFPADPPTPTLTVPLGYIPAARWLKLDGYLE